MDQGTLHTILPSPRAHAVSRGASRFPWPGLAILFGATSIIVGGLWDISWHSTVGRDTFWTSAHMAIYVGGVTAGLAGGWAALRATFGADPSHREAAIRIAGARAPLGAWVAMWGALAMITSAPFDDWWHNAYGLDVKILSPPHAVLALGMFAIALGGLLFVAGWQNRCLEEDRPRAGLLTAYAAGIHIVMAATLLTEHSFPNHQRSATFYMLACFEYPKYLVLAATTAKTRWPATKAAAIYMGIVILMGWILPLFPARPLLAPIYNPVDHMVPPAFPLVLVAPALLVDLLCRHAPRGEGWRRRASEALLAVATGAGFLGVFLAVQWHFSEFLIGPSADNRLFFGGRFFSYMSPPGDWMQRYWGLTRDPVTMVSLAAALLLAILSAWIGLVCGGWLSRVKR